MQILEHDHERMLARAPPQEVAQQRGQPTVEGPGSHRRPLVLRGGDAEEGAEPGEPDLDGRADEGERAGHALAGLLGRIAPRHAEGGTQELEERREGRAARVGEALRLDEAHLARPAGSRKLETQAGLADACLADHAERRAVARERALETRLQLGELRVPPDQAREAAPARQVEARAQRPFARQRVHAHRAGHALHRKGTELLELEEAAHPLGGLLREVDATGFRELLHARGQAHGVSLRGVVHAEVVPDPADDDAARVETHARREVEAVRAPQLRRIAAHPFPEIERSRRRGARSADRRRRRPRHARRARARIRGSTRSDPSQEPDPL
jgi:hypothetical protein